MLVDIDDTIIEVHGYAKQGAGFGYSGVRGLNALLATVSTDRSAPVVVAQRLRKGSCGSPRGRGRLVADALEPSASCGRPGRPGAGRLRLLRRPPSVAALAVGAEVSVTVRLDPKVKAAIATIGEDAWTPIEYTDAVYDEHRQPGSRGPRSPRSRSPPSPPRRPTEQVPGRLVVRRIPDLNPRRKDGQDALFDTWRFHAFFTTTDPDDLDTVAADKTHRGHAIIEQVHADLKNSALAHLPSGKFTANAAWLVLAVIAFNLTRAAATITGADLAKATTATIRAQADRRPGPGRDLGPPGHPAPADRLALGDRLDPAVHPRLRTTAARRPDHPAGTARPTRPTWNTLTARSEGPPRPRPRSPPGVVTSGRHNEIGGSS